MPERANADTCSGRTSALLWAARRFRGLAVGRVSTAQTPRLPVEHIVTPLPLQIEALPAFTDNYIWRFGTAAGDWLVDPGDARVMRQILQSGRRLSGILITHHHPDHIGGLGELPEHDRPRIIAPRDPRIPMADQRVEEGDSVDCDGIEFAVWHVPGHTLTHVVYVGKGLVFCGDTLFSLGCGRLFEGSPAQMHHSLQRLAALPMESRIYPAHEYTLDNGRFATTVEPGNRGLISYLDEVRVRREQGRPSLPSTIAIERACNPFLRCTVDAIKRRVEARLQRPVHSELEVFSALREWKDVF